MNSFLINLKEKVSLKAGSRELGAGSGTTQITIMSYALRPLPCANGLDLSITERR
jgi:hypothetical protein